MALLGPSQLRVFAAHSKSRVSSPILTGIKHRGASTHICASAATASDAPQKTKKIEKMSKEDMMKIQRQGLKDVTVGELLVGKVKSVRPYGANVLLPGGAVGLVRPQDFSAKKVEDISQHLKVGQDLKVYVKSKSEAKGWLGLSTRILEPEPGDMVLRPREVAKHAAAAVAKYESQRKQDLMNKRAQIPKVEFSDLKVGYLVDGVVTRYQQDFVLLDLGGVAGVLKKSDITRGNLVETKQALPMGSHVKAVVTSCNASDATVTVSTKVLEVEGGEMLSQGVRRQKLWETAEKMAEQYRAAQAVKNEG